MEVIDSIGDFFRFIEFSTRRMASNQKRSFRRWKRLFRNNRTQESTGSPPPTGFFSGYAVEPHL